MYIYIVYVYIDIQVIDVISWITFCVIFFDKRKMKFAMKRNTGKANPDMLVRYYGSA